MLIQLGLILPNNHDVQGEWERNKESILSFLETARGAVHGLVTIKDQNYQSKSLLTKSYQSKSLLTNCDLFR